MSRRTWQGASTNRRHDVGKRQVRSLLVAVLVAVLVTATAVSAPASLPAQAGEVVTSRNVTLEERTRDVASQLRCPVCQGNSIQDSPSELAQEMKGVVRDQLAAGKTPDEVRQYFVDKYGEWILLEPKASGFNLVVYLLPLVGVLVGGVIIWRSVKKWTAEPAVAEGAAVEPGAVDRGHAP
ncbi:MAG: cytochrome c-type biogenesis protein CcmH [Gemmatimonadaceae bacterium]|nr:cytochrome c-type biogenesis protein CcmH [Gemmatimonadaceae bacterium]